MTTTTEKVRKIGRHEIVPMSSRWPQYRLLTPFTVSGWRLVVARVMTEPFAIAAPAGAPEGRWLYGQPGDWVVVDRLTGEADILEVADPVGIILF